jgi:hypothetical protein
VLLQVLFLNKDMVEEIQKCNLSEEISRTMPGKRDFVSVIDQGERKHLQKQLVLCNLKAHQRFKEQNPDTKVGFSIFAVLRLKQFVLAGGAGTHSVCVCTIHQNVQLMFAGGKLDKLTEGTENHIQDLKTHLAMLLCNAPSQECYKKNVKNAEMQLN